jgi:adiponectin receptor
METNEKGDGTAASTANILSRSRLLAFEEIEGWRQDNEYIRGGYRALCGTHRGCLATCAQIHNETVNIHTHLWGTLVSLILAAYIDAVLRSNNHAATVNDRIVFVAFFMSLALALACSAAFHAFTAHSAEVATYWLHWDFVGIILVITGCAFSGIYYMLYCESVLIAVYWLMVSLPSIADLARTQDAE